MRRRGKRINGSLDTADRRSARRTRRVSGLAEAKPCEVAEISVSPPNAVKSATVKRTRNLIAETPRNADPAADRKLVDAALTGNPKAWEALYHLCHRPLLAAIRAILRARRADPNVVDELAARVWYAVVRDRGALLDRFDPQRGCRLSTFLSTVAKDEASRMFRSERRRRRREAISCEPNLRAGGNAVGSAPAIAMAEFEATLTATEKKFYQEIVAGLDSADEAAPRGVVEPNDSDRSKANVWQLRHRVRRKLERFLEVQRSSASAGD